MHSLQTFSIRHGDSGISLPYLFLLSQILRFRYKCRDISYLSLETGNSSTVDVTMSTFS